MDDLIKILCDKTARIDERDDAAMDLSDYDESLNILIEVASDINEDPVILSSCAGSIAEIWRRSGIYDQSVVERLALAAQSEIRDRFSEE